MVSCEAGYQPLPFLSFTSFEPASKGFCSRHLIFLLYLVFDGGQAIRTDRGVAYMERFTIRRELFEATGVVGML